MAKKKKNKWIRLRHSIVRHSLYPGFYLYSKLVYNMTIDKFDLKGRQYVILFNHQTAFDQFFVGMAFDAPVYYLASEDLFSKGFISKALKYLVAPIPIKKQTTDVGAVMNCLRVAREGGNIALAPEGNRTYSGHTEYIKPAVVKLVRTLKLPLLLYRIEGGYGVHPRWSDVVRKGKMHCYVSRVVEPEEYASMTDDELLDLIRQGLYVHEGNADAEFHHSKRAEYLERAMYVCPFCGLTTYESHGSEITCGRCGRTVEFAPTTELKGKGFDFPFSFVADWYDYQCDYINKLELGKYMDMPAYVDKASLYEVELYKNKHLVAKNVELALFGDRISITGTEEPLDITFEDTSVVTILGKNKLNIYFGDKVYQIKGDKRFNALKYMNFYFRYKNTHSEVEDERFLGL
ncbi:MAG: 1-acyl-sn-glycerol-3-phosphate acyltransferase [Clostridia bacterium]|nr:1-acyl-sn-glycerol-3-phosphate acyltransferase [Clostridia bacterium]